MKQIKLYVTDNPYIAKGIRNKRQLKFNTMEGLWDNIEDRTYTVLMEISPQSLYATKADNRPDIGYLERYRDSEVKYHNAFEPTPEGRNRFRSFCSLARLKPEDFLRVNTETADFREAAGRTESAGGAKPYEGELLRWAEQAINEAYTQRYRNNGYDLHYSCRLFPIFSEIKKAMDETARCGGELKPRLHAAFRFGDTDIQAYLCDDMGANGMTDPAEMKHLTESLQGVKGKVIELRRELSFTNPPEPYCYLDLLQNAMSGGNGIGLADAAEILYNFYLCNLITFPRTPGRSISPDMLHKIMNPASIHDLPGYEKAIEEIRYNDIPDHLLKNSHDTGAILLLDHRAGDFASLYEEVSNRKEKTILDMLIRRQLCLYAEPCREERCSVMIKAGKNHFLGQFTNVINPGWKSIDVQEQENYPPIQLRQGQEAEIIELEEDIGQEHSLHDIASIIKMLKLYSFGNMETIAETIELLYRSVYIGKIGGRYLTLREKNMLSIVPPRLKDMEEYCRLMEGIRSAFRNGESVNKIKKNISGMIQENLVLIDSFCKKGADLHDERTE